MNRIQLGMILSLVALAPLTGCVSQSEADKYQALYRKSQEQNAALKHQLDEARARNEALASRGPATDPRTAEQLDAMLSENDRLAKALADAESQLRSLAVSGPILPAELDHQLVQLAASNPELMTYDPDLGMVKFQSDLTFALGSANVRESAEPTLRKLAQIANSTAAAGYELRIVGHTDNVPIGRAETRAAHPTNWHLSVHRAISVRNVLESAGVPAVKTGVAGYGQYRPVVANSSKGAEPNRRVEIFLLPTTAREVANASVSKPAATSNTSSNAGPTAPTSPVMPVVNRAEQPEYEEAYK